MLMPYKRATAIDRLPVVEFVRVSFVDRVLASVQQQVRIDWCGVELCTQHNVETIHWLEIE